MRGEQNTDDKGAFGHTSLFRNTVMSQNKKCSTYCLDHIKHECRAEACPCNGLLKNLSDMDVKYVLDNVKHVYTFVEQTPNNEKLSSEEICIKFGLSRCVGQAWPDGQDMIY